MDLDALKINREQGFLQLPFGDTGKHDLNMTVRKLIDGPIGQSGRHIVAKKRQVQDLAKVRKRNQKLAKKVLVDEKIVEA